MRNQVGETLNRWRKLALVTVGIAALATPVLLAQADFNGKWRTEAPSAITGLDIVTIELKVDNGRVTGSMTRTDPPNQPPVKIDAGTATSDTITFAVKSLDGQRTITFTGKLKGDEIDFTREAKGKGGSNGIYGLEGPKTLAARRLTSAPPRGNAASAARLKFAAASLRLGDERREINRVKCRGVDGELWSPPDWVDPTPARQGRCTGGNVALISLLMTAYASSPIVRIVGFPLPELTFYQIEAVADDPSRVTKAELKQMLQTLLEDRFKAQVHTTTRDLDGFVLTVAKGGIKFKETSGSEQIVTGNPILRGKYRMEEIVKFLRFLLGPVPIVDKTALNGLYDMTFEVDEIRAPADENQGRGGPTRGQPEREFSTPIPKAVEDQLGLHLERAKLPVEFLIVDHLELATEN